MRNLFGIGMWLLAVIAVAAPTAASRPPTLPGYQNWKPPVVAGWRELNRRVTPAGLFPDTPASDAPDSVSAEMPDMRHGDHK